MSTTQPQIVPPPHRGEDSTPAEAPREISLSRPSPADLTDPIERGKELAPNGSHKPVEQGAIPCPAPNSDIPDEQLHTRSAMRLRLRELVRRMVALSERIAADGISREDLAVPVQEGDPCSR